MRYIQDLKEGMNVNDVYLCRKKQALVTRNGKSYDSLILQDKTGSLDAKIWEPGSMGIDDFEELDYIHVVGDVTSFQGAQGQERGIQAGGLSACDGQGH